MPTPLNLSPLSDALTAETDAATGHVGIGSGNATPHDTDAEFSTALGVPRTLDQKDADTIANQKDGDVPGHPGSSEIPLNDSNEESPTTLMVPYLKVPGYRGHDRRLGPSEIPLDSAGEASPMASRVHGYFASRKIPLYDSGEQSPTAPRTGATKKTVAFADEADLLYAERYAVEKMPKRDKADVTEELKQAGEHAMAAFAGKESGESVRADSEGPIDHQLAKAAINRSSNKTIPEHEEPAGRQALDGARPAFLADITRSDDLPADSKSRKSKLGRLLKNLPNPTTRLKQFFRSDKTAKR